MNSRRRQTAARRKQKKQKKAGAPPTAPPAFLLVGKLHRPHGVRGEMIMSVLTDFPERLQPETVLYMDIDGQQVTIKSIRHHNRGMLIAFRGYDTREAVDHLRNRELFVRTADLPPLAEGESYVHETIGLKVVAEDGRFLGRVADWFETGANGVFVVRDEEGNEILLPDIDEIVLKIDVEKGEMRVHLMEGLIS